MTRPEELAAELVSRGEKVQMFNYDFDVGLWKERGGRRASVTTPSPGHPYRHAFYDRPASVIADEMIALVSARLEIEQ